SVRRRITSPHATCVRRGSDGGSRFAGGRPAGMRYSLRLRGFAHGFGAGGGDSCILRIPLDGGESKRYTCLAMKNANTELILGIDIGGTKCAAVLGTATGEVIA